MEDAEQTRFIAMQKGGEGGNGVNKPKEWELLRTLPDWLEMLVFLFQKYSLVSFLQRMDQFRVKELFWPNEWTLDFSSVM